MKENKSIAFIISYLMGEKEDYLRNNFKLDYDNSEQCKNFQNYFDVPTFRSLSVIRQSIFTDYDSYKNCVFPKSVEKNVEFLKGKGILLEDILNTFSINNFFNALTDMINILAYKCLVDLDIPKIEELLPIFNFPNLSVKKLDNLVEVYKELGITTVYVYGLENIKSTIFRAFKTDNNLFYSLMSIQNKYFSGNVPTFSIQYRKEKGVDIDESIFIDFERVISKYSAINKKTINTLNVEQAKIVDIQLDFNLLNSLPVNMNDYLQNKNLKLFVDCDNVELFKFLAFIQCLNPNNVKGIVLLIDEKSNYLWKVFSSIYKGPIKVRSINVPRLKEHKSVVDVVLTKEVCESVYLENIEKILLVSSDSDFFGLISSLLEVDFGVCYVSNAMGQDYLKYLEKNNIPTMDLLSIEDSTNMTEFKDLGYSFLLLYELSKIPMTYWTINSLSDILYSSFTNETDITVNKEDIKKFISENYGNVMVDIRKDKVYVSLNEYEIEVE